MSLVILITTVIFTFSLTFFYISKHNREIRAMTGMMAAMSMGMLIGLLGGTIVGIYFAENLYLSTIIGLGIGMIAGAIIGLPLSLLASIEGMLSGLMGGMMGAMLGAMISSENIDSIIKILFLIEIVFNLIIFYLIANESKERKEWFFVKWLKNPMISGIAIMSFFFLFNTAGPITLSKTLTNNSSHEQHNVQNESAKDKEVNVIQIGATDNKYNPVDFQIKNEQQVTINFKNTGTVEHDIQIDGLEAEIINRESHQHGAEGIHIHAEPGKQSSITFKALETGVFEYYCTLPGHKESGMIGNMSVL
ncbi:cupredoxin domain-containing protein [Metabacillus idriensis]|uniref:cupredoxin domain-containing protein n=1 Tax=Metabacillus idriensis TaxID=324768 RepID=UPI0008A9853C|nr:cupredoxin domain-containing protein [Metabacillus idriensis]MCM3597941.1 cupredoxin domain-containing protein [Metabacillus idriensis]